jgi:DNA-directed RNA polymerase subunit RPC12/RpoP
MLGGGIKVKCRKCGKDALASEFVLDSVYGMMVCSACSKDRRSKSMSNSLKQGPAGRNDQKDNRDTLNVETLDDPNHQPQKKSPAGWDKEDEYLENAYKSKMSSTVMTKSAGPGKVHYKCPKCKYEFVYNTIEKKPSRCPYCSSDIFRFRSL